MQYSSAADIFLQEYANKLFAEVGKAIFFQSLMPDTPEDIRDAALAETELRFEQASRAWDEFKEVLRTRQEDAAHILERSSKDPMTGRCDAMCTITSTRILRSLQAAQESAVPLVNRSKSTSLANTINTTMTEQAGERGEIMGTVSDSSLTGHSGEDCSSSIKNLSELIQRFRRDGIDEAEYFFDLPLLVVEHKKDRSMVQGSNQLRMNLAACTAFLEALCIHKFPVFGLLTNSSQGVVTCCEIQLVEIPMNDGERYPLKVGINIPRFLHAFEF